MEKIVRGIHQFQATAFETNRALFEQLSQGQRPETLLITCSDSRIAPDLLMQTQPGDLFVLRNAGNLIPAYGAANGGEGATIEHLHPVEAIIEESRRIFRSKARRLRANGAPIVSKGQPRRILTPHRDRTTEPERLERACRFFGPQHLRLGERNSGGARIWRGGRLRGRARWWKWCRRRSRLRSRSRRRWGWRSNGLGRTGGNEGE